jgi:FkbM family methyltransferase
MSIVRKLKEQISTTSQKALGLDGLPFNLESIRSNLEALGRLEEQLATLKGNLAGLLAMCSQLEGMSAQIDEMGSRIEIMSTQNNRPVLNDALRRLQTHEIEIASLVDVGASNGKWSKSFARYFPDRHHLLVDANKIHLPGLTKICRDNPNWHFELTAVGATKGELYFDSSDPLGGHLATSPLTENYRPCPVTTIDYLLEKQPLPGPFMIKLDTHGVEIPILTGAAKTLSQTNVIVVEVYNFTFGPPAVPFWELCRHMLELGFRPLDAFDLYYREIDNAFWQFDLLFARSDLPMFEDKRYFAAGRH